MGDKWIIVIPAQADFVPTREAQQKAVRVFERLAPEADEIVATKMPSSRSQVVLGNALAEAILLPILQGRISRREMEFRGDQEAFPSATWERGKDGKGTTPALTFLLTGLMISRA